MEYCGLKSSSVRAATMKKSGKARKSHSRRRCFGVADAGQNSSDCMRSPATRRCVVNYADNTKAEARRARSRSRRAASRGKKGGAVDERPKIGSDGSFCAKMSEQDCRKASSSKKFPCEWRSGAKRSGYCARKSRSEYTQGVKVGGSRKNNRRNNNYW